MASESDNSSPIIRDYARNYNQEHWSSFHKRKSFRTPCFGIFQPYYDEVVCLYENSNSNKVCKKKMHYMAANSYRLNGIKRNLFCNYHTDYEKVLMENIIKKVWHLITIWH